MLRWQQQATQNAITEAAELRKKLASAPAPIEKPERPDFALSSYHESAFDDYWPAPSTDLPPLPPAKNPGAIAALITLTVALAVIVVCVMFWASSGASAPWKPTPSVEPAASAHAGVVVPLSSVESSAAFSASLADLSDALSEFPGSLPVDLLWRASQRDPSCLLQWNDGSPAFLFGAGKPHPYPLSVAISRCADAVRRLRQPGSP